MPAININDLNNAQLDVTHIAAIATSTAATATDRLGNVKKTISGLSAQFLNAGVYATTAAGLTATVPGQYFSAIAAESDTYLVLYLNNAGVAVEQKRYPNNTAVASNTARLAAAEIRALFSRVGFINTSGVFVSEVTWGATVPIAVANLTIYRLSLSGDTNAANIAFYDANNIFISGVVSPTTGVPVTVYPTPPAGAVFVVFTYNVPSLASQVFSAYIRSDDIPNITKRVTSLEFSNIFSITGFVGTSGVLNPDANWGSTPLLAVAGVSVSALSLFGHPVVATIAFYDSNKAFISGVINAYGVAVTAYPTPPTNAAFVTFTCSRQFLAGQVFSGAVGSVGSTTTASNFDITAAKVNYARYATISGYITTSGADSVPDSNWVRSDFMVLEAGSSVNINAFGNTALATVAFYSANKAFISAIVAPSSVLPGAVVVQTAVAPANTAYFRTSFGTATNTGAPNIVSTIYVIRDVFNKVLTLEAKVIAPTAFTAAYKAPHKLKLLSTDKVLLYGDSISSTDYPWFQSAMQALTGATVYNGGFSGYTAAQLAGSAQMQRIYDYGARLVIAMIGGNDTGAAGSVGTFTVGAPGEPTVSETSIAADYVGTYYIQAVSHIIRKFQAQYSNLRVRAGLTGSETEAQKTALIDALLKPVLVFATPLPQQRNNSADPFSQPANWKRKRDAVAECCAKYKIHCVDLTYAYPVDMSLEPFWPGVTDKTTNYGNLTMDGLHPNKYGYQNIAEIHCADIGL